MKTNLTRTFPVFVLMTLGLFMGGIANSQTTLVGGDIAFVGINSDSPDDELAFMLLKDISAGTSIVFTDHQWRLSGGFTENTSYGACNTDAFMTWTSTSAMYVGNIVVIRSPGGVSPNPSIATASSGTVSVAGGCPDFSFSTASTGETVFAYQGTKPTSNSATNFIAAINYAGVWAGGDVASSTASEKPTNLSNSHILMVSAHIDNIVYKGSLTGTAASLRTSINNYSNWQSNDVTGFVFPQDIGSGSTLPVVWQSFEAQKQANSILLEWKTASEQNSSHFIVQHSTNGVQYTDLATINAAGNSNSLRQYSFTHAQPAKGNNFYRILQTDLDGNSHLSTTRNIQFQPGKDMFVIKSNPVVNGQLAIYFPAAITVTVLAHDGRQLIRQQVGAGEHVINVTALAGGYYFVKAGTQTEKIIIR